MSATEKPKIGIISRGPKEESPYSVPEPYLRAVVQAGGTPILLPTLIDDPIPLLKIVDGLLVPGGGDLDPRLYNGRAAHHPTIYSIDAERDQFEREVISAAMAMDKPNLLICRAMQSVAVCLGSSLVEHLPDEYGNLVDHRLDLCSGKWHPAKHMVRVSPDSRLAAILQKTELRVVSCHHQAIRTVPSGWRAVAFAPDGVLEAIENLDHPWAFACQWHPELSINDTAHQRLFEALIAAARLGLT